VYIGSATHVRFETTDLSWGTDTKLKVFEFDGLAKGQLRAKHDDLGGVWYDPNSKSSRVDLYAPANTSYLIKVLNKGGPDPFLNDHQWPTYTLKIQPCR